jgi:hypothetical protein
LRPTHFRSDHSDRTPLSSGETEDRSWWKTSRELVGPARGLPTRVRANSLERRSAVLPEDCGKKRMRDVPGKPGARRAGIALERRKSP